MLLRDSSARALGFMWHVRFEGQSVFSNASDGAPFPGCGVLTSRVRRACTAETVGYYVTRGRSTLF